MKITVVLISFFAASLLVRAADKPLAYDPPPKGTEDGASIDQAVNTALANKYAIVLLKNSADYAGPPKVKAGKLPSSYTTSSGETISGYVLIAYVVTADGRADDPVVLKTTNARLSHAATDAMTGWRFEPAKLNGTPIATTAAQEFNFKSNAPPEGFAMDQIILYQPNDVLVQRLLSADRLAAYIKQLQAILSDYFSDAKTPETLHTIVAIRPGNEARVWFVSSTRSGDAREFAPLRQQLEAVKPVDVHGGPVAFSISASIAGGDGKDPKGGKDFQPPIPKEWLAAAKDLKPPILVPDGYLKVVWPDGK